MKFRHNNIIQKSPQPCTKAPSTEQKLSSPFIYVPFNWHVVGDCAKKYNFFNNYSKKNNKFVQLKLVNMRKFLFLFFTLFISATLWAQLEIKEGSFKEVSGFVNINTDKMYDDNDKPYAVLKIKTENISGKQRRELNFGGDAQTFFEVEYKDGEVWLYISYYATFIKISHEELSSTEIVLPFDMQPNKGYEMILVNKYNKDDEKDVYNYLIVKADQPNAVIYIDDEYVGEQEVYKSYKAGGKHNWRIV